MSDVFSPEFYRREFEERVFPFWERYSIDGEAGGFFTCFSNDGARLLSTDKFTWSQGRMLWVLPEMARTGIPSPDLRERCLVWAGQGARFLMEHCLRGDGSCIFLMDRFGNHKPEGGDSIYADCFAILGTAHFGRVSGNLRALEFAKRLAGSVAARVQSGRFASDPYPVPDGLEAHGIPMILTNTCRTLADALEAVGDGDAPLWSERAYSFACTSLDRFAGPDGVMREFIRGDGKPGGDALLFEYCNPGHTAEDCWFMLGEFARRNDLEREQKTYRVLKRALELGWDEPAGGLQLFAGLAGGEPRGGERGWAMEKKVRADWSSKLWWVHAEALYASALAFARTGDPQLRVWAQRLFDYCFTVFPNRENDRGEWIQIRDRYGDPDNRVVALPVKDPFHISRSLLLLIQLLEAHHTVEENAV